MKIEGAHIACVAIIVVALVQAFSFASEGLEAREKLKQQGKWER